MKKIKTIFPEVWIIEPDFFEDVRGFFYESYSQKKFKEIGIDTNFVQDNHSRSQKNTVRGLHFQAYPGQVKLVRCTIGNVWDVVVDIRPDSSNFGKWFGCELSEENHLQLYIPVGFAHGFSVLSEYADFQYKVSNYYDGSIERTIQWNDPDIGVDWKVNKPILSERDLSNPSLREFVKLHPDPINS